MLFEKLRTLNVDRIDIDDAIELVTYARHAEQTYSGYQVPTPEWLKDAMVALDNEIRSRRRDMLEARKRELFTRLGALKTREEKKEELSAELAKVNDALGTTQTP